MGHSSQSGHVILRSQATPGVLAPDLATAGVGIKLRSGGLATNRELLIPDAEIGGGRDIADAYLGASSWSGDYEFYPRMNSLATLLKAAFGSVATTHPTDPDTTETHTFTPIDNATLPLLSIEEYIGSGLETYNYTDAVVNTLHFECEANGYLTGTCGLIAKKQIAGATPTATPVYDNLPMIVGTNVTVTYDGVQLPAKSFSFDLNNNVADDDFRLGSFYLGDLTAKRREITMGVSIRPSDSDLWRQATYGQVAATQVGGIATKKECIITMQTYEVIPDSSPTAYYSLSIPVPLSVIKPYSFGPSGDDVLENDLEIQAIRPDPATPALTAIIQSDVAVIA
jgi:hypothetical protein